MKKTTRNILVIIALLISGGAIFNSCKKPDEGLNEIFNTDFTQATVNFEFVDATTGETIGFNNTAQTVTVTIEGQDKSAVVDNAASSAIKPVNGYLTIALAEGEKPSESNPYTFHVVSHATGYLSTSTPILINKPGTQTVVVKMVSVTNTPEGVEITTNKNTNTNATGATKLANVLKVTNIAGQGLSENIEATVNIPQGVILMDENKNPILNASQIETKLVHFNPNDESSLSAFPGGFAASTASEGDIVFKTGGFIAMEMTAGNKEIKNFSAPINMTIEMPKDITNTEGTKIYDGMVVPIWSYEPSTGKWTKESEETIKTNTTTGKLEVSFDMIHLSYWNIDWFYSANCTYGAPIKIKSDIATSSWYQFKLYSKNSGAYLKGGYADLKNGETLQLFNTPKNVPVVLKVYNSNEVQIGEVSMNDMCSGTYTLNVAPQNLTKVKLDVDGVCANKPGKIYRPRLTLYGVEVGTTNRVLVGEMVNGYLETEKLTVGKTYEFYTPWNGQWIKSPQSYKIESNDIKYTQQIPTNICNKLD